MNLEIESIKRRLLVKYPPLGSIVANVKFIEDKDCYSNGIPTAGTDGMNIYYHPDCLKNLSSDEKLFLFAHEVYHIAFDHINRGINKDRKLWNIATDAVVNALLKKDNIPIRPGSVDIPEAVNYDAEAMYQKLLKERNERQNQDSVGNSNSNYKTGSSSSEQNGSEENHDVGHDTHSMWGKAIDKKNNKNMESEQERIIKEEIKKIAQLGEKEFFRQNRVERKKQLEELRRSLVSQSHGYGTTTNGDKIDITDIGISKPLIDWRLLLKEAVKYDIDWSYQNAEIEDGVLTAHLEKIPVPETEIVLDTSGSIDKILLKNFLRECKNILQVSRLKVGCFDTNFYGFTEIRDISEIDNLEFYGGGGTDFNVAVNAFTRRVENKIIFTDGDAPMPDMEIDAIWVVFGNKEIEPKGGKVIYIDNEALKRLLNYETTNRIGYR